MLTSRVIVLLGTSTGLSCGYSESKLEIRSIVAGPIIRSLSPRPFNNSRELRSLEFYVEKTIAQLTNFFPDQLWSAVIPQLSHTEACTYHALLALASYHERFLSSDPGLVVESSFALCQYNMAIKMLLDSPKSSSSVNVNLISLLIFFCIEVCLVPCTT